MLLTINLKIQFKFFQRLLILFMPAKYQPDEPYLRHVSTARVHLFTIIQLISTSGLYAIKYIEAVAITFPVLVNLLILSYFFFFRIVVKIRKHFNFFNYVTLPNFLSL